MSKWIAFSAVAWASVASAQPSSHQLPPSPDATFQVVPTAELLLPREQWIAPNNHSFRAVALDLPQVYVADRLGGVYVFQIDPNATLQKYEAGLPVDVESDGEAMRKCEPGLLLSSAGRLLKLDLAEPLQPRAAAMFGVKDKRRSMAIVPDGRRVFLLQSGAIVGFDLGQPGLIDGATLTESEEIFRNGCMVGRRLCASVIRQSDRSPYLIVFQVAENGRLIRKGEMKTESLAFGVHALQSGRVLLVMDEPLRKAVSVSLEDPEHPVPVAEFPIAATRCSVVAQVEGLDVLVTGYSAAVVEDNRLERMLYPYSTSPTLDSATYGGAVQGDQFAIVADSLVHIVRIVRQHPP